MKQRNLRVVLGLVFFLLGLTDPAASQDWEYEGSPLEGLRKLYVQVLLSGSGLESLQLSGDRLKMRLEKHLQQAGFETLPEGEYQRLKVARSSPLGRFTLILSGLKGAETDLIACSIISRVDQVVFLSRKPVIKLMAPTWERRILGFFHDADSIQGRVLDAVDEFVRSYQSAN